ncbi:MAG: hypothetical protein K9L62_16030 [Vallitaleaceae bacterium]|nr:hypothetical protein [Vallitaleaceae bacterium]
MGNVTTCQKISGNECDNGCRIKLKKKNNKYYDQNVRKNSDVYHDKRWVKVTNQCKDKFRGLDIYSYYIEKQIVYGNLSHHIIEVDDCNDRMFDISNLVYVSNKTHGHVHSQYEHSEQSKLKMQKLLFELIKKWETEMMNGWEQAF